MRGGRRDHPTCASADCHSAPPQQHTSDDGSPRSPPRQHALITIWQLYALGLDTSAVAKRVARGALHRRYRGVYVVGQPKLSPEGEWLAAALAAGPGAALSHRPAGKLHGISRFHPQRIAVVTDHQAPAQGRRGPPRPRSRPTRPHDPQRHPRHHGPSHPRRPRRRPHAPSARQRHPRSGLPRALRRGRRARLDGPRLRTPQAARARAGDRTPPRRQRGHQERGRGRVPDARLPRAATSTPTCTASRSTSTGPSTGSSSRSTAAGTDARHDAGRDAALRATGYSCCGSRPKLARVDPLSQSPIWAMPARLLRAARRRRLRRDPARGGRQPVGRGRLRAGDRRLRA